MPKLQIFLAAVLLTSGAALQSQVKRTSVPLGNAVSVALAKSSLTGDDARPFHIQIKISEPENPQSPYQGSIEEWWVSKDQWRREVTGKEGLHQTIVVANGNKTEKDEGNYFPLWLRSFVTAAFDPIPDAAAFIASGASIDQVTLPNGYYEMPNVRLRSKIGTGDRATDAFSNISFDTVGRLTFYGSPRYSMEFHNYKGFGKKQVARELDDSPEPGTKLVGDVVVLEDEDKATTPADLFTPLATSDDRFASVHVSSQQLEQFTPDAASIEWPPVRSGNIRGHLAVYIGVDSQGQVREAWPLNSDNAGLEDPARDQIRKWKLKPAVDKAGNAIQIDGGLGFLFETRIDNPIPGISGADIQRQMEGCKYNPTLPAGVLPSGTVVKFHISVNEKGQVTGKSFSDINALKVMHAVGLDSKDCHFKPYIVNGQPSYYFLDFVFTAP
jgi:hypothetical protein